jgi:Ser/Thr protein kinase RdoA (MazF antagonist)
VLKRKPPGRTFDSFASETFEEIVAGYGLGAVTAVHTVVVEGDQVVLLGEKSETSRKYLIETSGGRHFLKEVPWYCDEPDRIEFSADFGNRLAEAGLPVPMARRGSRGAAYVSAAGSRFVLYDYRPGRLFDGSVIQKASAARGLARLHATAAGLVPRGTAPAESVRGVVRDHLRLATETRPEQAGPATGFGRLGSVLLDVLPDEVDDSPVHGDFIPWNTAYDASGELHAIYDFDNACLGSPLRDLGKALSSFNFLPYLGRGTALSPLADTPPGRLPEIAPMVEAYDAERRLSSSELRVLPRYVLGGFAASVLLSLVRGEQRATGVNTLLRWFNAIFEAASQVS